MSNHPRVRARVDILARIRVRGGLSPALTSNDPMPTSQACHPGRSIASYLSAFAIHSDEESASLLSCLSAFPVYPPNERQ